MNLSEIIEYINKNVISKSQLEGMRGMGLSLEELPASYKAKKQRTDSGIDYYICNRNETTRNKMYEKLVANIGNGSMDAKVNDPVSQVIIDEKKPLFDEEQKMKRVCRACGTIISDNALFCHKCGEKYEESPQKISDDEDDDIFKPLEDFDVYEFHESTYKEKANIPDLVAENALLSPCPDTECTHGKEYYAQPFRYASYNNLQVSIYNHRLYYIKREHGYSVWCSKEDGSERFCLIDNLNEEVNFGGFYIVTNYYGIFLYDLDYQEDGEFVKGNTRLLWYDFSGKLKKKINFSDNQHVIDIYIYGANVYYSAYFDKKSVYSVNYFNVISGEKKSIPLPEKFKVSRIMGNNSVLFFYMDYAEVLDGMTYNAQYDSRTGWSWMALDGNGIKVLKHYFNFDSVVLKNRQDEEKLPKVEFIDLKRSILWVNDMKEKSSGYTTLAPFELENGSISPNFKVKSWLYPKDVQGTRIKDCRRYFDGEKLYVSWENAGKFFAYDIDGNAYGWWDGQYVNHSDFANFVVLGDYIYMNPCPNDEQYRAELHQSSKCNQEKLDFSIKLDV